MDRSVLSALSLANYLPTVLCGSYCHYLRVLAAQRRALTTAASTLSHFAALQR